MGAGDIILLVAIIIGAIVAGLYFLNKWASKKQIEQDNMVSRTKMPATIYVIDKKHDKFNKVNLPKVVMDNLPKMQKLMKFYFVKAKIGPQITTLICDKNVYNAISVKKNVKVELAGIYIVSVAGMKTPHERRKEALAKKKQKKLEEKTSKAQAKLNKK